MKSRLLPLLCGLVLVLGACGGDSGGAGADGHVHDAGADPHDHGSGAVFGEPADPADADQVIGVEAMDAPFRFEPAEVEVSAGEVVAFEVVNGGDTEHEFVLLESPTEGPSEHQHSAGDANATTRLGPGDRATVAWTFTEPGEYVFECHVDQHHLAGMRGTITVSG